MTTEKLNVVVFLIKMEVEVAAAFGAFQPPGEHTRLLGNSRLFAPCSFLQSLYLFPCDPVNNRLMDIEENRSILFRIFNAPLHFIGFGVAFEVDDIAAVLLYGFHTEPIKMDGINTKKLVVNPDEAANIRLIFEMYAQPTTSYGDITRYFAEQGILFHGKELIRPTLAQMLRNPVYVQADLDVYEFFKSQGTVIVNDAADFTGMNGCYLYQGRDVKPSKKNDLKDQMLVLAPHEGIVPSDIWLTCRKKLMNNMKIQSARKATHTWLAGKIKCGNCGYALMSINNPVGKQYLRCTKRLDNKSCAGCGKIITSELEAVVYQQMVKKLASYKTLTGRKKAAKANPKIAALQVELLHVDSEIEKLVDSLTGANNVLLSYVNVKIAELDGRKQELLARIAELTVEAISPEQVSQISGYLDTWEDVSFDDKRRVVDLMITTIAATSDSLNITWKI